MILSRNCRLTFLPMFLGLFLSAAAHAQLSGPNGIVFDSTGHLWVANNGANSVLELDPSNGTVLATITDGISSPSRLTFAFGNLYVTNIGTNNVTVYDPATLALVKTINNSSIKRPLGIAVDAYGDIYIANNSQNNIVALNIADTMVETLTHGNNGYEFIAPGVVTIFGKNIYAGFGRNSGTNAVFSYNVGEFLTGDPQGITEYNDNVNTGPTGVAFDSEGNVYISEYTSGTAVKYAAGKGKNPLLVINNGTGGCEGIAVASSSGDIYVSNSTLNNITVYNSAGTLINTLD